MDRLWQGWRRVLVSLLPVALLLAACSGATGVPGEAGVAVPQGEPSAVAQLNEHDAPLPDETLGYLTINVDVTDDGFQPPSIFIPAGQVVQLVMRNQGSTEHHFRVLGLRVRDLLWLAPRGQTADIDAGGDEGAEHEHEHGGSFVPFRATSPAGIRPIGDEVHAYAAAGGLDVVIFIPDIVGTFLVQDPLHPSLSGKVIVF